MTSETLITKVTIGMGLFLNLVSFSLNSL